MYRSTTVAYSVLVGAFVVVGSLLIAFAPPSQGPNTVSPIIAVASGLAACAFLLWWGRRGWAEDEAALRAFLAEALAAAERSAA